MLLGQLARKSAEESANRLVRFSSVKVEYDVRVLRNALQRAPGPLPANVPELRAVGPSQVACHRAEELLETV